MKRLVLIWLPVLVSCAAPHDGSNGVDGKPGLPGAPGHSGSSGSSCSVRQFAGSAMVYCTDGTVAIIHDGINGVTGPQGPIGLPGSSGNDGADGHDGSNGNDGHDGASGPKGDPGTPGTVITSVNLCPGTTTYPSVFVETALCIDNNLYGVYSANGGFLTYLAPGNYSSNAIGSACNLTIHANCVVSH